MVTAFVDMMGVLMVIPLLPFYVTRWRRAGSRWPATTWAWGSSPRCS
jgi:hypothetical protein